MPAKPNDFMREAMKCAMRAAKHDDVPIGAVIVKNGEIVARGENKVQKRMDPTAHAEMEAIRTAGRRLGQKFLDNCDIYVTLEPCAMCAAAISFARIRRLVYAAEDAKGGGVEHGPRVYDTDGHLFKPAVIKDEVYSDTSAKLLKGFFKKLRAQNANKDKPTRGSKLALNIKTRAQKIIKVIKK
jgi:tRNA(adenine34) deaminase